MRIMLIILMYWIIDYYKITYKKYTKDIFINWPQNFD